jgi:predicted DNA-binding transcriptional regulator AlpA
MKDEAAAPDALSRKADLAKRFQCSTRQIEIMVNTGRLPRPFYLGDSSPRWRQSDIDAWLDKLATDAQQNAGGCSMSLPYLPDDVIDEAHDLRRRGYSLKSLANHLRITPEDLGKLLGEATPKEIARDPEATNSDD